MPTFLSSSLLTLVVVAGIAAVGWLRGRSFALKDDPNKKKKQDKEIPSGSIEIVVNGEKSPARVRALNAPADTQSKKPLDFMNRRQHVKAVCDRFESRPLLEGDNDGVRGQCDSVAVHPLSFPTQFQAMTSVATSGSTASNQCESPPKGGVMEGRRLPSLVTATDWVPKKPEEDEENPVEVEATKKPVFRRMSSISASKPPMLASFMATKPPAPSSVSVSSQGDQKAASPEMASSEPVVAHKVDDATAPAAPPLVRKASNSAERLLQFQQLVPSNQARSSFGAN